MNSVDEWLLAGDPAIRYQTMRDLTREPADVVAAERARMEHQGWCAQLLALQAPGGYWHGPDDEGWMGSIDALVLLKEFGLDPASESARRAIARVEEHLTFVPLDNRQLFEGETEPCINGAILAAGSYFGRRCDAIVDRLLGEQLGDGGWNCDAPPSVRSSFNSTIRVLEGLLAYERAWGATSAITDARHRGHEYLLERGLFRSKRTGEPIDADWSIPAFPTTWHYDVLRALDYLRDANVPHDARADGAIAILEARRRSDGTWTMDRRHRDRIGFEMETVLGEPSRWITLRARRALDA